MASLGSQYPNLYFLNLEKTSDWRCFSLFFSSKRPLCNLELLEPDSVQLSEESYRERLLALYDLPRSYFLDLLNPRNKHSIGASSCLVEAHYVDRESAVVYSFLYSRAFRDYPRRAVRLHFFSKEVDYDHLLDQKYLQDAYLGFVVLSAHGRISRAVLSPPRAGRTWWFFPAHVDYPVNLAGVPLQAVGVPFAQQDGRISACATASAWMSTVILASLYGFDTFVRSMPEITALATQSSLPPHGRVGPPTLNVSQLLWALREMGYEPLVYDAVDPEFCREQIYYSIESGIPPLLIIALPHHWAEPSRESVSHCVTAFGHTYDPKIDPVPLFKAGRWSTSIQCPYFLINDDQIGPYLKIAIEEPNEYGHGNPAIRLDLTDPFVSRHRKSIWDHWYKDAYLQLILILHPPRHIMSLHEAVIKGCSMLASAYDLLSLRYKWVKLHESPLYRVYLSSSNRWKQSMLPETQKGGRVGLNEELSRYFRGHQYPKYIWIIELSDARQRVGARPEDLRVFADITIDPTSDPEDMDFLTMHIPGLFMRMFPWDQDELSAIENHHIVLSSKDTPYQPFISPLYREPTSL